MALKAAIWIQGTIVEAENPGPWINVARKGWGTHFKMADQMNWFHIPFSTPVILDDVRPLLEKIFVFYETRGDARITNVHIYDGKTMVKAFDGLSLSGDRSASISARNSWAISPPITIRYGLGISIAVQFGPAPTVATTPIPEIIFYTAGADFRRP